MRLTFLLSALLATFSAFAQSNHSHRLTRALKFPDIDSFRTLKCDFHQHTVFSDGVVWPDIRVQEALMDGLDAISLTEHLEYQPHKADIPHPDRNRSFELALSEAKDHDLLIVRGSEITRRMPPGHNNAIFLYDANKLLVADSLAVFEAARAQDAFIFWNHPNWTAQRKDGMATLTDFHRELIKKGLLNGIEVINDVTYSEEALQIALDQNLTIMGTSDIHGLIDWQFNTADGGHRPATLVFAKEKSLESIREALFAKRTVAVFKDLLVGREAYLLPLIKACLTITDISYQGDSQVLELSIQNNSSVTFSLENLSGYTFHEDFDLIKVPANGSVKLMVKTIRRLDQVDLKFRVMNAVYAPGHQPEITLKAEVKVAGQ